MGTRDKHFYHASDYAGMSAGRYGFYFGYEETAGEGDDEEWCFVAKKDGKEVFRATASQIGWSGGDPTEWGVLEGIALYIESKTKAASSV